MCYNRYKLKISRHTPTITLMLQSYLFTWIYTDINQHNILKRVSVLCCCKGCLELLNNICIFLAFMISTSTQLISFSFSRSRGSLVTAVDSHQVNWEFWFQLSLIRETGDVSECMLQKSPAVCMLGHGRWRNSNAIKSCTAQKLALTHGWSTST